MDEDEVLFESIKWSNLAILAELIARMISYGAQEYPNEEKDINRVKALFKTILVSHGGHKKRYRDPLKLIYDLTGDEVEVIAKDDDDGIDWSDIY